VRRLKMLDPQVGLQRVQKGRLVLHSGLPETIPVNIGVRPQAPRSNIPSDLEPKTRQRMRSGAADASNSRPGGLTGRTQARSWRIKEVRRSYLTESPRRAR
jgi:hypothetical protein